MTLGKFGSFMNMISPIGVSCIGGGFVGSVASASAQGTFLYGVVPAVILAIISSLCIFTIFSKLHLYMALMGVEDLTGLKFDWGD
jgi:hypothetical protein